MSGFKVGDKVRCVNNVGTPLVAGAEYVVEDTLATWDGGGHLMIAGEDYREERFVKVEDSEPALPDDVPAMIREECRRIEALLLQKNERYGNSALDPQRVFSKASPIEQLLVRIDDKISRIKTAAPGDTEDPETDLIGYLILLKVARRVGK